MLPGEVPTSSLETFRISLCVMNTLIRQAKTGPRTAAPDYGCNFNGRLIGISPSVLKPAALCINKTAIEAATERPLTPRL